MKPRRKFSGKIPFITIIIILFGIFQLLFAQQNKPADLSVEIKKLSLFKNGLAFLVSEAELPGNSKLLNIGQLPVPVFGTFWVSYPENTRVKNLITAMEESAKESEVQFIPQLLQLNEGKKVVLHTAEGDIEGTIMQTKKKQNEEPPSSPYFMSTPVKTDKYNYEPEILQVNMIRLKTDKGIVVINANYVSRAEFPEGDPVTTLVTMEKRPSIRIELEKPAAGENISVSSLVHGITWSPGYLIDLSDPQTAGFSANAVIINELADLNNVKLELVTGFPNIRYSDINSPVAKTQSLSEFLNALTSNQVRQSNALTQQVLLTTNALRTYDEYDGYQTPGYSTASEGLVAEDLFFYPVQNFSLKRNETAWIPLFTAEMTYKHIYTWKIGDFINEQQYYQTDLQNDKKAEEIWHCCRLNNSLNFPLTTAPAEFITNGQLTGQDMCYYTPAKGETTIRINKALNVLAEQAEVEIERTRDAAVFHGYRYDLVKVKGELKLENKLDKNITVEIAKELSGELLESSPPSKDTKNAKGLKQVNEKHSLTWELELKAGSKTVITYQYQVYIKE